jgi:hypothetical protein
MEKTDYEELVLDYFKGVDEENIDAILETLTEDCVFSIETHGIKLVGHKEIISMFKRLWKNHKSVEHKEFYFVKDPIRQSDRCEVSSQKRSSRRPNCIKIKLQFLHT